MIRSQFALIRRELWEHRSLYVTPAVIGLIVTLMTITGQVSVSAFDQAVDVAILGGSNLSDTERGAALTVLMVAVTSLFALGMCVLSVFYALDALFAERKERSILFWRSMPCTDSETVISKLLTALIVIPLITFAAVAVTHVIVTTITGIWISIQGGDAGHLVWSAAPFADNWIATFVFLLALPLWLSPFIGWFLFVSAFTKRSPMLMAFLPIFILPMLERSLLRTHAFAEAFFVRTATMPLFGGINPSDILDEDEVRLQGVSLIDLMDVGGFLSSPGLWIGIAVCALFTAAAIYVRRYRDDS